MAQNKYDQKPIQLGDMIFFQNLVPGKQQSPLIDHYRSNVLNAEKDEHMKQQREALLMEYPPILSFHNDQQKKEFYDEEAKCRKQFCCGALNPLTAAFINDIAFSPKDDYVFSSGNGQFYTGSQKAIGNAIKGDISQAPFGSTSQQELMSDLKAFDDTVAQRGQSTTTFDSDSPALAEIKSPNPFNIIPKPKDQQ
ncbi:MULTISPECIES: hypothetical protein [Legionella]|uniref:Uncharacterized protein n=1 Tax=Legionella steelei TaxID=947033 RepID=A0A0W0ZGZ3_9GAMM|nr:MULTISPECIES: hypothetical protein [Legionella]KTD68260.1 hypothetical protein Lste_1418 [Legionella steelei]MBN9226360.1 hypothetical protein [Legionella steelei]OJW12098.1 MAG: hypothetical protein BGO44_03445 [Legionella sp. 39-23]